MEYLIAIGVEGLQRVLKEQQFTIKGGKEVAEYEIENNPILGFLQEVDIEDIVNEAIEYTEGNL